MWERIAHQLLAHRLASSGESIQRELSSGLEDYPDGSHHARHFRSREFSRDSSQGILSVLPPFPIFFIRG